MQHRSPEYYSLAAVKERLISAQKAGDAPTHRPRPKWAEAMASIAVVAGMFMLFGFVKPSSETARPNNDKRLSESYDFRPELDQVRTVKRAGWTTVGVGGADVLEVLGADAEQAASAVAALKTAGYLGGADLDAEVMLTAHFEQNDLTNDVGDLVAIAFKPNPKQTIMATRRLDGSYFANTLTARVSTSYRHISGTVTTNLRDAIIEAGGTRRHALALAAAFPKDASLKQGGKRGERFEIVFEAFEDERGRFLEAGRLVFAAYRGRDSQGEWYRHTPSDTARTEYFDEKGRAAQLFLTRRPVRASHISSGFGMRLHPIGGYEHLHTGIDYSAPIGAKVFAAGDGIVESVTNKPGYGRYIKIRHGRGYETAYAHLSAFDRAIYVGKPVQRGDLIGYVGRSGGVTGPHLHFEIRRNGSFVNPVTVELPSGRNLQVEPERLSEFNAFRNRIDTVRHQSIRPTLLTDAGPPAASTSTAQLANP